MSKEYPMVDHAPFPTVECEKDSDQIVARKVGLILAMEIPHLCMAGVAMNTRLLADHLAILRRTPEGEE
ncbi:MAG: alpha/beta hydrolase [Novosphingobium sp.]